MKKFLSSLLACMLYTFLFFSVACKKETPENPCVLKSPISADFQIYEVVNSRLFPVADTLVGNTGVSYRFIATTKDANGYEWATKFSNPNNLADTFSFVNELQMSSVLVKSFGYSKDDGSNSDKSYSTRLIISKNTTQCKERPVVKVTSESKIYKIVPAQEAPIIGTYKGKIEGSEKEITVIIDIVVLSDRFNQYRYVINGLWGAKDFWAEMKTECMAYNMYFFAWADPDLTDDSKIVAMMTDGYASYSGKRNELTVEYTDMPDSDNAQKKKFVGKRIK